MEGEGGLVDRVEYKGLHAKHADMEAKRNLIDQGEGPSWTGVMEGGLVDRGNGGGGWARGPGGVQGPAREARGHGGEAQPHRPG